MARILALLIALSSVICSLNAQNIITTFAGGPKVFTGGPATSISVSPSRIAVSPKGEVYFGDREANVVLRLNADGTLSVIAGNGAAGFSGDGGPATHASLNQPAGFAVDSQGNLYIGDARNFRVRKVDTNGIITTVAGNGQQGFSGDGGPATAAQIAFSGAFTTTTNGHTPVEFGGNIAVDAAGNLYIADTLNNRVRKVSGGVITTVAGNGGGQGPGPSGDGGPATSATVLVTAVAVDSSGNLYIGGGTGIRKVSPAGTISTFNPLTGVTSLATDSSGNLYASNGQVISRVTDSQTSTVFSNITSGSINNAAAGLYGIAVDSNGTVYAAADIGEYILKIPANAPSSNIAGTGSPAYSGDGGPASSAGLSAPNSMTIDAAGTIYIADTNDRRVRSVDRNGIITTFADLSTNPFPAFGLYNIAVAADGGILIDDRNSIQEAHKDGSLTQIAVSGGNPTASGGPGVNIPLQTLDIASDTFGNTYVINNDFTVGKIDKAGVFSIPNAGVRVSCAIFLHQCITTDHGGYVYVPAGLPYVSPIAIARITPTGSVTMIPVTGASAIAGIAVDSLGNIYLSDTGNHNQVLKISPDGATTPFAGNGQYGFSGDGGPAIQATLFGPVGLLVDNFDNVYIADNLNNRVRKVASGNLSYFATPNTLSFQATAGGAAPPTQTVMLTAAAPGLAFTASVDSPWLTVTPFTGVIPATLQVGINPALLTAGAYKGTITISLDGLANPITLIAVNLTLTAGQGNIAAGSPSISFAVTQGSANTTSTLTLTNSGGAPVNYTASIDLQGAPNFVSVSATTGTITSAQPVTLTLTANPQNLAIGSYNATLRIAGNNGQTLSVPVTLTVAAPMQRLVVSQGALSFIAIQGGAPAAQTLGLVNTGNGVLSWMVTASPLSGSTGWLSVDKSSGNIVNPFKDVALVSVMVNPAGLSAGDYFGQIVVTSAGATGSPQVIPVSLSVVGADPGLDVSPSGLVFNGAASSQDVVITNRTGKPINFTTAPSGFGFTYTPASGVADPSNPTAIHVSSDFSKVPPGDSRRGSITISFADGSTRTISVLSVVGPLTSQ